MEAYLPTYRSLDDQGREANAARGRLLELVHGVEHGVTFWAKSFRLSHYPRGPSNTPGFDIIEDSAMFSDNGGDLHIFFEVNHPNHPTSPNQHFLILNQGNPKKQSTTNVAALDAQAALNASKDVKDGGIQMSPIAFLLSTDQVRLSQVLAFSPSFRSAYEAVVLAAQLTSKSATAAPNSGGRL